LVATGDQRLGELVGSGARRAVWGGEVLMEVEDVQGLETERKNEERRTKGVKLRIKSAGKHNEERTIENE
jgi:hypothetical protein